jgi:hypothetical protein
MSIIDYGGYLVLLAILGAAWITHSSRGGADD